MRVARPWLTVALSLLVVTCGRTTHEPRPAPEGDAGEPIASLGRDRDRRDAEGPSHLAQEPLRVGATAPRFFGYPERTKTVLVFFRGAW